MTKKCLVCNKGFNINKYAVEHGKGKFCSKLCFRMSRRVRIKRTCQSCGITFEVTPSELKRGVGKMCSKKCTNTFVLKNCLVCKKEFKAFLGRGGERKYCSRDCYIGNHSVWNKGLKGFMAGEQNNRWLGGMTPEVNKRVNSTDWKNIRKEIYKRDNWTCLRCKKHTSDDIQCHHRVPWRVSHNNSFENLVTLCTRCHGIVEWEYLKGGVIFDNKLT